MKKTCVIVLSFGMGEGQDNYGASNWELAKIASRSDLPVIAQWEIARLMKKEFFKPALISIERDGEKYLDSYDVLIKAKGHMKEQGFTEAILLGHQDHLMRIKLIAKKMGIKISNSLDTKLNPNIPYDGKSTQWWTRNRFLFFMREILVYPLLFLKRQI